MAQTRWNITDDGAIVWNVEPGVAHNDNIEMSGQKVSVIVTYGVDTNAALSLSEFVIFPTFRTIPQDTYSQISTIFADSIEPDILLNHAAPQTDFVESFRHKGIMQISGRAGAPQEEVTWTRIVFPSTDKPVIIEMIALTNVSNVNVTVDLAGGSQTDTTPAEKGLEGAYVMSSRVQDSGERLLRPGEGTTYVRVLSARHQADPILTVDANVELKARAALVQSFLGNLQLETPDKVLNTAFAFAKIRTTESIYKTRGGLMHSPGGGRYYAAIWANDQAEYANPFFPFIGDPAANESATNTYRMFADYMNPAYKPIPSSIVAEDTATWDGAGDRGDMAMIAYGASRYALARGNKATAENLWPLIQWCLEYCHRQLNTNGVVHSDRDELEGRFPSGSANLCTSSLYYDALNSAVYLGKDLGKPDIQLGKYLAEAKTLHAAIEKYFEANVEGFQTYRYYEGDKVLRAWICIPLAVGIFDRAQGTIAALFSSRLWTPDGLATQAGDTVFWDRSTLYALRGVFAAGDTEQALHYLQFYSNRRLLGEHVPYPVESYPEGNQSHLAAESALYCRIFTEGMFGIRPTGLHSFTCTPRLPKEWQRMVLKHICAFGNNFDLTISRVRSSLKVQVSLNGRILESLQITDGGTAAIDLE